MFMQIAIGAIGIGIVIMIGYLIIAQVRAALPTGNTLMQVPNQCRGYALNDTTYCNVTSYTQSGYGSYPGPFGDNTSSFISVTNTGVSTGMSATQTTVFAGFALLAVGIIVLAAFGLINVFK